MSTRGDFLLVRTIKGTVAPEEVCARSGDLGRGGGYVGVGTTPKLFRGETGSERAQVHWEGHDLLMGLTGQLLPLSLTAQPLKSEPQILCLAASPPFCPHHPQPHCPCSPCAQVNGTITIP
jgi:hypothetical protein